MKNYFSNILLILMLLFPVSLIGQQYNFQIYSVNKGLPHSQVHDIFQTHDGYVWIGTFGGGLAKFDGHSFKIYNTSNGLRTNNIEVIFEDSRQNLWVSTINNGVAKMKKDFFTYPFKHTQLDSLTVLAIEEIGSNLWFGTIDAGIFTYNYKSKQLSQITKEEGLVNNTVWDFWQAPDGNIWIATHAGISVYNGRTFKNITKSDGLSGSKVFKIAARTNGDLWFATNNGITIWNGDQFSKITSINGIKLNYVFGLLVTSSGAIWIGTELEGVFVYEKGKFTHFTHRNGLSSNYIYELYEGRKKNVWIATDANGINILKGKGFKFLGREQGLGSSMVFSLFKAPDGQIWAGTFNGIYFKQDDIFKKLPLPDKYVNSKEIWDIAAFENGNILFLMPDNLLYKWDGNKLTNYSKKHGLKQWFIYDLVIDDDNTLWLGTDQGLFHYRNGKVTKYTAKDGLAGNFVRCVYEFDGNLWIGTYDGLSRFDGHSFENITVKDGLGHKQVSHITSDSKGNIWLGTSGGITLIRLDENNKPAQIKNFGAKAGMKLVKTQIIWFDEAGYLWQGTNGGIHRLNVPQYWETGKMAIVHYPLSSSGIGVETNHKALAPLPNNEVLFGTMNGILKITPSLVDFQNTYPLVHITDVKRNAQPLKEAGNIDSLKYRFGRKIFQNLHFPYGQQSYSFHFSALEYKYPNSVLYRYRLKGFDDEWSAATPATSASYTNLEPGDYTFLVQAKSRQGNWPQKAATLTFSVDKPFWQAYWFYSLVLVGFGGLIYAYTQLRLQVMEKRRLKELVDEQTKDLSAALEEKKVLIKEIHHRVKNNLAVISGLLELQVGYSENEFAAKILRESQRRVKSISMIHEKLYQNERLSEIKFAAYINELIKIIADSYDYPGKEIKVSTEINNVKLGVNQGIPCGLILHELLSNAYEHAFIDRKKGEITVKFSEQKDGEIEFSVTDNGIGLSESFENEKTEAKSLGITLVETLTQQLDGQLVIKRLGEGTCFAIKFLKEKQLTV